MSFHFDLQALVSTLPVMLYGMLGGFLVMLVLYVFILLLYRVGKTKKSRE